MIEYIEFEEVFILENIKWKNNFTPPGENK